VLLTRRSLIFIYLTYDNQFVPHREQSFSAIKTNRSIFFKHLRYLL